MTEQGEPNLPQNLNQSGWQIKRVEEVRTPELVTPQPEQVVQQELTDQNVRSSLSLMFLGVFGGAYLLMTWAWLEIAKAYSVINEAQAASSGSVGFWLQVIVFWLAPLAPALWYLATVTLTQRYETLKLSLWLFIGLLVLFPFPFFFEGGTF